MTLKDKFILKNNRKEIADMKVPTWYIIQLLNVEYGKKLKKNYKLTEKDKESISNEWGVIMNALSHDIKRWV